MTLTIGDYIKKLEDEIMDLKSKLDDVLHDSEMIATCSSCETRLHADDIIMVTKEKGVCSSCLKKGKHL